MSELRDIKADELVQAVLASQAQLQATIGQVWSPFFYIKGV
jgi:hypothetical protein